VTGTKELFHQLQKITTEQRNAASANIDAGSVTEILSIINAEDKKVALAVEREIPNIAQAVELIVKAFVGGGRLIYVGAGTSGRMGVLDASECPPTFGVDPDLVQGIIAGGDAAMFRAQEGAEDKRENGAREMDLKGVSANDVVCGIAASLRTPYVIGAVIRAKELGARTLYVTTNPRTAFDLPEYSDLGDAVDVKICAEVGPEVIMGSTRMKSGTAQKLVLNMLTTASMIRMGKVYENMMIDLQMTNKKLIERSKRIVMTITGLSYDEAARYLELSNGHVKTALVMIKAGCTLAEAQERLAKASGFVRAAIDNAAHTIE